MNLRPFASRTFSVLKHVHDEGLNKEHLADINSILEDLDTILETEGQQPDERLHVAHLKLEQVYKEFAQALQMRQPASDKTTDKLMGAAKLLRDLSQ